ncbi:cobalamin-binding protein [Pistricoccus aurantiacus]|uniref:cobalamin-binding protein n=1 Tax=Pistricoccus aurantiacus TaxID=1883414 RepID=UPI001FEC93B6|nr:cobalamin-binding protein [Pistricoccus aurantiacus]
MSRGGRLWWLLPWLALTLPATQSALAEDCATDVRGQELCLDAPAQRIVALSPGATELLFAAGAGDQVIAAVSFSDYPREAKALPRVGTHDRLDLERLLALSPDLVVGWRSGNPREQLAKLERLGVPVFMIEPKDFAEIADTLNQLGRLTDTAKVAGSRAKKLRDDVAALEEEYEDAAPIQVFYQVWDQPLMTVNGDHWISRSLSLCGGVNVFADQAPLVPRISREAVLARAPQAIITGGMGESDSHWLAEWRAFNQLPAVRNDNLFLVDPDLVQRPTPRLLEGTRVMCERLDRARAQN